MTEYPPFPTDPEEAMAEVYRPEGVALWRKAPNPMLDGEVPDDLIARGEGDRVVALCEALAEGVVF